MADKRIDQLTAATSLGDSDLFVVEQSDEAKKATGSVFSNYLNGKFGLSTMSAKISSLETEVSRKQDALTLPLPIAQGGTGGASLIDAQRNLGVVVDVNNDALWAIGTINVSTGNNSNASTNRLRIRFPIGKGIKSISVASGYRYQLLAWNGSTYVGVWNGTAFAKATSWKTAGIDLTALPDYDYKIILAREVDSTEMAISESANLTMLSTTDSSLKVPGAAADAEIVGEKIGNLGTSIGANQDLDDYTAQGWYYWLSSSNPANNPTSEAGTMAVYGVSSANAVQIVYSRGTTQRMFWRLKTTSAWTSWKQIAYTTDIESAVAEINAEIATVNEDQSDAQKSGIPVWGSPVLEWEYGKIILSNGAINSYTRSAISEFASVYEGQILFGKTPSVYDGGSGERSVTLYLCSYDSEKTFLSRRTLAYDTKFVVPTGTSFIRFACTFDENATALYNMTRARLLAVFGIGSDQALSGNGERPVYVAIGASTTVGAVHNYSGTIYSARAYPDYVGSILGLRTANLGIGTTGLMARNRGNSRNYMDQIYDKGSTLSEASLVTIMFAYGNDSGVGLPVGEWDDYYPYDEFGHFFVDGDDSANSAGVTSMVSEGATLFGCLNWCIKWIGEHYSKAQIIVLMGYPANNADSTITITNSSSGVSPNKISVDRSASSLSTKLAQLRTALNIPMFDLLADGLPFSYYASKATNEDGTFKLFSTVGTVETPTFDSHPNETGYLMYARYLAGKISSVFQTYGR